MRTLILAPVVLLLCLASPEAAVADGAYTNTEHGFTIDRPEAWTFSQPTPPAGAIFSVKLAQIKDATETSVTVHVVERADEIEDSTDARDAAEENWKREARVSGIERGRSVYAGVEAKWLKARYDAGAKYTIRQHFLLSESRIFILQCLAPEEAFTAADKDFEPILKSFAFVPVDEDRAKLLALADKCGREVRFAETWPEAAARAKAEDKTIMVVFEVYRGVVEGRFTTRSLFMHPDVVEIVNARFVPIFWTIETRAPFDHPSVFGLGPSTFGTGIMFATPEGKIIAQTATIDPYHIYDRCREVLKDHPGKPPENQKSTEELLRRGDLEAAEKLLAAPAGEDAWKLAYELQRKLRSGEGALNAIKQGGGGNLEEALIHIGTGEYAKAEKLLAKAKDPQGMFLHCVAVAQQKGVAEVRKKLREIALGHPDSRWAWLSAAILTEPRLEGVLSMFNWPDERLMRAWAIPAYEAEPDIEKARRGAIDYLLLTQDDTGRWVNPRSKRASVFDVAISSICASSLLPYKDEAPVRAALKSANEYVLAQEFKVDAAQLFDYGIWAEIFALDFIARCNEHGIGQRRSNVKVMQHIIKDLEANQYKGGGWGYFNSPQAPDNTIGFVTAAAILSLQRAAANGATLPPRMLERAMQSIAILYHEGGSFGYMWATGKTSPEKEAEASLRSPLYALALKRGGGAKEAAIARALDVYLKYREHTIKEKGKSICHTGPEGTAAYYLLFGYRFAAEAVNDLPEESQPKYRDALLNDVQQYRLNDGSYCDYPNVGREYGTGMALAVLSLLSPEDE